MCSHETSLKEETSSHGEVVDQLLSKGRVAAVEEQVQDAGFGHIVHVVAEQPLETRPE